MTESVKTYCKCMEDVKRRVSIIHLIVSGHSPLGAEDLDSEVVCLQLRKMLEMIAFGSLSAHKDVYEKVHKNFSKHWNAKRLLSDLEKIHPEFYPKPVSISGPDDRGVKLLTKIDDGYLTQDEFIFLYNKCSEALHSRNPFRTGSTTINFERPISEWILRVQALLNIHFVQFLENQNLWVVHMLGQDGKVHAFPSEPVSLNL